MTTHANMNLSEYANEFILVGGTIYIMADTETEQILGPSTEITS